MFVNWLLLLTLLLHCQTAPPPAGSQFWPYTGYATARLYTFNETYPLPNETQMPQTSVVVNGDINPAATYVSEIAPDDMLQIVQIMTQTSDMVAMGLSKCFIPRHGIVLYDDQNNIQAQLSMCFECDQIVASPPVRYKKIFSKQKVWKEKDIAKAEKDIAAIAQVVSRYAPLRW
ncbi:MAG TPA: hypothetical protein PK239_01305 [Chitinophagales bacterium]|nr:hypothetical protein [Chitinophagales bacterium]HRK25902.1 hypothetical protein [Chitinophagales bacterium]